MHACFRGPSPSRGKSPAVNAIHVPIFMGFSLNASSRHETQFWSIGTVHRQSRCTKRCSGMSSRCPEKMGPLGKGRNVQGLVRRYMYLGTFSQISPIRNMAVRFQSPLAPWARYRSPVFFKTWAGKGTRCMHVFEGLPAAGEKAQRQTQYMYGLHRRNITDSKYMAVRFLSALAPWARYRHPVFFKTWAGKGTGCLHVFGGLAAAGEKAQR